MKKAKILSAFLSLTLCLTSFASVPMTASAEDSVTTVTTSEAEEGKFTAVINIFDDETYEEIKGLHVQFVEYEHDWKNNEPSAEIVKVIADWNTNDTSQMIIENIDSVAGHFYAVTIPELPEGYSYSWKDNVVQGIHFPFGGAIEGTNQYDVGISHHPPLPTLEYPIDVDREFTFSIIDESTNESVEGLDVELALMSYDSEIVNKYNYVKTLDTWNTSDDLHHSITLPLHFDSDYDQSYLWGIKINNMPDGYMYRDIVCDDHMVNGSYSVGKYKRDLYNNKEVTDYSYFIKPIDYQPVYSTTVTSEKTTAVTTTTTTDPADRDKIIDCTAKVKLSFIDYFTFIPIEGLDVTVTKDDEELLKFNTTETPEILIDVNYSTNSYTSADYKLDIKGFPEEYGYKDGITTKYFFVGVADNGKIADRTFILAPPDMGYIPQVTPEDNTFGFYSENFTLYDDKEIKIPFTNIFNVKVTAEIDTTDAEIIEINEKYVILKEKNPCCGTLTVTAEDGRTIKTGFYITRPEYNGHGTGTTTAPMQVTTTTTTTATEPIEGDANCDGQLNMADAVLIMQSLANPDKYGTNGTDERHLTAQGEKNADIAGDNDGVTNLDALAVQKKLLKLE